VARYSTASEILNGAAVESGLAAVADPYTSTDPAFVQLRALLNNVGRELLTLHPWEQLIREATVTIAYGGASRYALPDTFDRFLDQTMWDRGVFSPVNGPYSPQDWQALKGQNTTTTSDVVGFRLQGNMIEVYPPPPAGAGTYATLTYEYVSTEWCQVSGGASYRDSVGALSDVLMYDPTLLIKTLKMRFLGAKGFDTTDISKQVELAFRAAVSKGSPGQRLSVAPSPRRGDCAAIDQVIG